MATHRRQFLKVMAASGMGSPSLLRAAAGQTAQETPPEASRDRVREAASSRGELLLTSSETALGWALAEGMGATYRLRLTARTAVPGRAALLVSDLGADNSLRSLVRGVEGIVHWPGAYSSTDAAGLLDYGTRCTYNLLRAAVQESVKYLVYLSTLQVMAGYPEEFAVDEDWRPLAKADSPGLAEYLGEVVCREFAREGNIRVVVLRLGTVVHAQATAGQPFERPWVGPADVVQAVSLALAAQRDQNGPRLGTWAVFHILSGSPQARFSTRKAERLLGYRPHPEAAQQEGRHRKASVAEPVPCAQQGQFAGGER